MKTIPRALVEEAENIEREMYLAGLRRGRADAAQGISGTRQLRALLGFTSVDAAFRRGYIHGFDGWVSALRNEAKKAKKKR